LAVLPRLLRLLCYLPLYIFCGSHLLAAKLRRANIYASAGAVEETARIVAPIRARWPGVHIVLRADAGFAREALMSWCEPNGVDFLSGMAKNKRLVAEIADELAAAEEDSTASGQPARRFKEFPGRRATAGAASAASSPRRNGPAARPIRALSSPR
jgi:hypothetical protein